MDVADITVAGSGLAATATLTELFSKLLNDDTLTRKLTITVIEKNEQLWLGVPYGSRSSVNALSITHVQDFIYEPERPLFYEWLKSNKHDWADYYRKHGGSTATRWLEKNIPLIEKEEWETVYIPRFLFGRYFLEKFTRLLNAVKTKGLIELNTIHAEVVDIKNTDDGLFEVIFEGTDNKISGIISRKVVLAIGSGPMKKMYENQSKDLVYFDDIYEPSVNGNLKMAHDALSSVDDKQKRNVLIIGSNASSIELLYLLEGMEKLRKVVNKFIVISPSGILPYHISTEELPAYPTPGLDKLEQENNYNIHTLMDAASADLKLAVQNGANVAYIAAVVGKTFKLVDVLGEEAKKEFSGIYGMKLSHQFRRSGPEYKDGSQLLIDLEEAVLLKGRFLSTTPSENGVSLNYLDMATGLQKTHPLTFKVIINCSGSDNLAQSSSRLIQSLIHNHNCKINYSSKGFDVNEQFEAAPNLYIMGPLLGGNMNKLIHFWHLENAPRIMYLAPHLANALIK